MFGHVVQDWVVLNHWTAGAGWMAQHWWEHWLVTGDREFLRTRTLPWLQETAAFRDGFA